MSVVYAPNPAVAIAHTLMHCFTPSSETEALLNEGKVSFSFDISGVNPPTDLYDPAGILSGDLSLPNWIKNEQGVRRALDRLEKDLSDINVISFQVTFDQVADNEDEVHIALYVNAEDLDSNIENFLAMIAHTLGLKEGDKIYSGLTVSNGCYNFPLTEECGIIELEGFSERRTLFYPAACYSNISRYKVE